MTDENPGNDDYADPPEERDDGVDIDVDAVKEEAGSDTTDEVTHIELTTMPTFKIEQWVQDHKYASTHEEAHPIDEKLMDENMGDLMQHFNLSVIQAVLDTTDILDTFEDGVDVRKIEETDTHIYYQVHSGVFHAIFAKSYEVYNSRIEVEQTERIVDLHTIQFLHDLYDYTGDFGGQTARDNDESFDETLCNAINDPTPYEGAVNHENEPENAHYGYVDARGLVVEKDTHE